MTISDEELAAFCDGECDAAARARIEQAAQADPVLAERIRAERALVNELRDSFESLLKEPVPPHWETLIRAEVEPVAEVAAAPVIDLAAVRAQRSQTPGPARKQIWRSAWIGGAMAASLVMGLFIGGQRNGAFPFAAENGALVARGELANALDSQLASAPSGKALRMLATFRNADGALCRAFSGEIASGIACHGSGGWQLRHVLPGTPAQTAQYRQAGSADAELMALAQQMAAGDPLDAAQEAQARKDGWR
ncbi:hypothetical protein NSE01_30340 [Novosphingobium sediminis]|uniref:Anti-sigma factor n=1 Tax=Novosphingobium sediminis TaxID=707214 RepID=A0A512ANA9_9SPHN|nr:anti-sigma factor [Novosphingobium sediminis]GEO01202.1 hypothetical protein NSE01_30340 [Novosphingobium sediminis]